jgi:hypothetical protein
MIATPPRRRGLIVFVLLFALATPWRLAVAQDDNYSATVPVDATSDSVAKARDVARADGARRALDAVIAKLAGGPDKVKPLKLSDNQVTDLVASFEVANEKMTAVRYTADYTYHFKPTDVTKVMRSAGIAAADSSAPSNLGQPSTQNPGQPAAQPPSPGSGKPVVVLPVFQDGDTAILWDDPNPWRDAWSARSGASSGGTTLILPLGDVSDLAAIDGDKARTGDTAALAAIAKQEGADDVLVMVAVWRPGDKPGLDVTVKRYHLGQFVDVHSDTIDAKPKEVDTDLYKRAADAIAADIDNGWKNANSAVADQRGTIIVAAPITGLDDWIKLRDRLSAVPTVRKIDLKMLSRQEVTLEIQYVGNMDQLKASLVAANLELQGGDPDWRLARADKP